MYMYMYTCIHMQIMSMDVDEAEHSLEMHAPYIKKVMGDKPFQLVPIMVGSVSFESAKLYGQILAPYVADPSNLFVISSDFCHWGGTCWFGLLLSMNLDELLVPQTLQFPPFPSPSPP